VVARFAAHRRFYLDDIVEVAFRRVLRGRLDDAEQAEIARLHKAGVALRNVVHMRGRLDARDFDELVSAEEQHQWLTSPRAQIAASDTRPEQPDLRHRHGSGLIGSSLTHASPHSPAYCATTLRGRSRSRAGQS
jgi:hypothetical protein